MHGWRYGRDNTEENLEIIIHVMSDVELHVRAARGYKITGTTNSFDGLEDGDNTGEAGDFWRGMGMRKFIDSAVADVEKRFHKRDLPWTH